MLLFHYTCLFHLPSILRDGLTEGIIPISPGQCATGPNLTGSPNPAVQHWSKGSPLDKTRVRIIVAVDEADPKLKPWKSLVRGSSKWVRDLDTYGQAKFWWVYLGIIPTSAFQAIEVREGSTYRKIAGEELAELVSRITKEREKFDIGTHAHPDYSGKQICIGGLKEGYSGSWLLDAPE